VNIKPGIIVHQLICLSLGGDLAYLHGVERARYVQEMFGRIAPRYDRMNRLMTFGQDVRWRREVLQRAKLCPGDRLLDLGTGTGDLAAEAARLYPACRVTAVDFTLPMMQVGQLRYPSKSLSWSAGDACRLPFEDQTFDGVISGFLLRNVIDVRLALNEQYRVLKRGGRMVSLDTTPPPRSPLAILIRFHLHAVIPTLGKIVAGSADAYQYLPQSTEAFLEPEKLAGCMVQAGFSQVAFTRRMFGTVAIHWGIK
jgi:demethylmenaquinone methyltransferase / 2-methoxy-6-polyprenyl-1,4-benzoquinol methylase